MTNDEWRQKPRSVIPPSSFFGASSLKKYRPPRPMGVKGGCSPQNNLKTALLVIELAGRRNKILHEHMRGGAEFAKKLSTFRARRSAKETNGNLKLA
jgi:hypothetical protein